MTARRDGDGDVDGDGTEDDPQLGAMRAVWRAMPDAEPPSHGLAELMAAARDKAHELARQPWWRRVLELARRPPVLALASIMVLIGGAVLVTQRKDLAEPTSPSNAKERGSPALEPQAPSNDERVVTPTPTSPPTMPTPATGGATPPQPTPAGGDVASPRRHRERALPPVQVAPLPPSPPPAPPLPRPPASAAHASSTSPAVTNPAVAEPSSRPQADQPAAPQAAADDDAKSDDQALEGTRGPRQVLVGQLLEQCRAAATRGDCEVAKRIAQRIAKQDAGYYREHVASDATISKCLAAP